MKRLFRWPHGARDITSDVDREITFHIDERCRDLEAGGMSPAAARAAAEAEFGDRQAIASEMRALRGDTVRARARRSRWEDIAQDLHLAVRGLRRAPGFAAVALLTLALGIGANSAVFSVVDSVLLRPLPYPDAGRLVQVWADHRARSGRDKPEWLTPPDFTDWRDQNTTFASMATYQTFATILTGSGEPVSLAGLAVSGDFFRVLGVPPALGRTLTPSDDAPGAEQVVVLSHTMWQTQFGGDSGVLNRRIDLNGESWRVVGVMPASFRTPVQGLQLFRAVRRPVNSGCGRGCIVLRAIGRLKPGVTLQQAQADIGAIARREAQDFPATNQGVGAWLIPLHDQIVGPTETPLLVLSAAVALVLLIACVNVATLLLLRGNLRSRELSVRVALGAGRGRLVRQLMTESILLAGAGGALGLLFATFGCRWLAAAVPSTVRDIQDIGVNATVIVFTVLISILSGVLFGLLPSIKATDYNLMGLLRSGVRETGFRRNRTQHTLVAAQLAIAVMLLIGAGLLMRSLAMLQRVDLGYRTQGVLFDVITFPRTRYTSDKMPVTLNAILDQVRGNPAIREAEVTDLPPLSAGDQDVTAIAVGEPEPKGPPGSIWYRVTSPGYLQLMRERLIEGRYFTAADRAGSALVGIVNAEAARRLWSGKSPLGRILATGEDSTAPHVTIVGVVATARQDGPNQPPKSELYVPLGQVPTNGYAVVVEPAHGAAAAVAALRTAIHDADPLLPFGEPVSMESGVSDVVSLPRLYALILAVFATAALILAMIGVYGVMAFVVAQRQREIGVRLALGASPTSIRSFILWRGARLALSGTALGLLGAIVLSRLLGSLLFGISAVDLMTFLAVPMILGTTAFLACLVPARRAGRIDPLLAIRQE